MKWEGYTAKQVKQDRDGVGNRLLSSFARDYKALFGVDICPNCPDFNTRFNLFLQKTKEMENKKKSGYVLKPCYNNIPLGFGRAELVNNKNMTDAYGKYLLHNNPKGKDLFEAIPEKRKTPKSKSPKVEQEGLETIEE